ncbi:MAG: hypothetical protein ACYTX0_18640 [Nostoc sp.]
MGIFASKFSGDAYGGLRLRIPSVKLNQQLEESEGCDGVTAHRRHRTLFHFTYSR